MKRRILAVVCLLLAFGVCRKWNNPLDPTNNRPPALPSSPSPDSGAVDRDTGIALSWVCSDPDSGDTVRFDVWFGTADSMTRVDSNRLESNYRPRSLRFLTGYNWRIVARDRVGDTAAGPVWTFSTVRENHAPSVPSGPSPDSGSTGLGLSRTLSWQSSDPDSGDAVEFDVYFGADTAPPRVAQAIADASWPLPRLAYASTYYWRVVARDNHGAEASGPLWDFSTLTSIRVTRPDSGARRRGGTQDTVRWTGGAGFAPGLSQLRPAQTKGAARQLGAPLAVDSTVIYSSTNNGASWVRSSLAPLPGMHIWTLPYVNSPVTARVQVRQFFGGDTAWGTSAPFTVYDTLPPSSILVTSPTSESRWEVGSTHNVIWTGGTDGWDSIVVWYSANNGTSWTRQGRATDPGSYSWAVGWPASTSAYVEVRSWCLGRVTIGRSQRFVTLDVGYPDSVVATITVGTNPVALCLDSTDNRLFVVTGTDTGRVAVVSCSTNQVLSVLPVGRTPVAAVWSRTSNRVYVANQADNTVTAINSATNQVIGTVPVGQSPSALWWNENNNRLYVAGRADSSITVIDCADNTVTRTLTVRAGPAALCLQPDRNRLFVANYDRGSVSIIDCNSDSVVRTINVGTQPNAIVHDAQRKAMWVANYGGNTVSYIDSLYNVAAPISVGMRPWGLAWNWISDRVYSTSNLGNTVSVINATTRAIVGTVPVGFQPRSTVWATWANKLYINNYGGGSVSLIDCTTNSVIRTIPVGSQPIAVLWHPAARRVYVASYGAASVAVIGTR